MIPVDTPLANGEWQLPKVRATLLFVYRAAWLILLGAAVASTLYFSIRTEVMLQAQYEAGATLGFASYTNASAEGQLGEGLGEEGLRLGFRDSDLLLAVDGHPISAAPAAQIRLLSGPDGSVATLKIRRSTGELTSLRIARDSHRLSRAYAGTGLTFQSRRWTQVLLNDGVSLVVLAIATLLFIRRQRDPVAQLLSFSLLLACVDGSNFQPLGQLVPFVTGIAQWDLLFFAILLFPDGRLKTPWHWLAILSVLAANAWTVVEVFGSSTSINLEAASGVATGAAIMRAIVMRYRATPIGTVRQQLKFVLLGFVAAMMLNILGYVLVWAEALPLSFTAHTWLILATQLTYSLTLIPLVAGLFVSLQRFRLYDAESTISRSVVVGALTLFLLAIFAGSEKVIEILGEQYFGEHLGALAGGLGAAIAAIMVSPLHHRVSHWAEHRFQGDLVHLRNALPTLVGDMRETASPQRISDAVLMRVENGVRASRGAIVVCQEVLHARDVDAREVKEWLRSWEEPKTGKCRLYAERQDPFFPLRLPLHCDSAGTLGWLLLGPRPDGSFYGKDERETLLAIADPVARALNVAQERERLSSEVRSWIGEVRARLTTLEARLV